MTSYLNNSAQPLDTGRNFNTIEFELENIYRLINPRAEFRENLKIDLLSYPKWKIFLPKFLRRGFLLLVGVTSGVIILLTGVRTVFTLIGAIKIFRQEILTSHEETKRTIQSQIGLHSG